MAVVIRCKMCGADLVLTKGSSIAICESCGTTQTVPVADNDRKLTLFGRANRLRAACDFDKAAGVYESIVAEFPEEAEAYWGLVLCKYGIEYVDDPATGKKIPTCHRSSFDSIMDDSDLEQALENADVVARKVYREEAKTIEEIRKGIIDLSSNERPYDIFICYKETDEKGDRTLDSVLAQDIYDALNIRHYRTFFARITLEDKLGLEYEPYIFAALNTARIMLVVGTDYEHFNAVWVKNEWGRYLKLMAKDKDKHLIPCYKGIDAYDMPKEFARLQAQDLGKVGAMQDLLRGIEKILSRKESITVIHDRGSSDGDLSNIIAPLLKRVYMFLEDENWISANEYCEKVLDFVPESAEAYLGKLLAELHLKDRQALKDQENPFDHSDNYQKALRFANAELKAELTGYIAHIHYRNTDRQYEQLKSRMTSATTERQYLELAGELEAIRDHRDAAALADICREKAEVARKDDILTSAKQKIKQNTIASHQQAVKLLKSISGWKDADELIVLCGNQIEELKKEKEKAQEKARHTKKVTLTAAGLVCVVVAICLVITQVLVPAISRKQAAALPTEPIVVEVTEPTVPETIAATEVTEAPTEPEEEKPWVNPHWKTIGARGIAVKADGTVMLRSTNFESYAEDIASWADIVSIDGFELGLKSDGTVVIAYYNEKRKVDDDFSECRTWTDIIDIERSESCALGLKSDGTVVTTGYDHHGQGEVGDWTDIVDISTGRYHTVGLKNDGTVVAVGANNNGQCNVETWTDVVAISAGDLHTVGLKADGTVVSTGINTSGQCDVGEWTDIVAVSAGHSHTLGLKSDGTVVAVGHNGHGQCSLEDWIDIVAIDTGDNCSVGLKSDGTMVAAGQYAGPFKREVVDWTDLKVPG